MPQLVHVLMGVQGGLVRVQRLRRGGQGVERRVGLRRSVAPRRRGRLLGRQLSLGGATLQVRGQAQPERILHVQTFDPLQVSYDFRDALSESHPVVIHRVLVGIVSERI